MILGYSRLNPLRISTGVKEHFSEFRNLYSAHKRLVIVVVLSALTKYLYGIFAVSVIDFVNFMSLTESLVAGTLSGRPVFAGVYTGPPYFFAPFFVLWLMLPVPHPTLSEMFRWQHYENAASAMYFVPSVSSYSFVAVMRIPYFVFDALTAILIYTLVRQRVKSTRSGLLAVLVWALAPPIVLSEMHNFVDPIVAFLLLWGSVLFTQKRFVMSSAALSIATLLRVGPILLIAIYAVSLLRARKLWSTFKMLIVALAVIGASLGGLVIQLGPAVINDLFAISFSSLALPEARSFLGPALLTNLNYLPAAFVAVNVVLYGAVIAIVTHPEIRSVVRPGDEIYAVFLVFVGLSNTVVPFLVWVLPFLVVDLASAKNGKLQLVLFSVFAFVWEIARDGAYLASFQQSFFHIPNFTPEMVNLSVALHEAQFTLQPILPEIAGLMASLLLYRLVCLISPLVRELQSHHGANLN